MQNTKYHTRLRPLIDEYVDGVYVLSRKLPKEELFGITSQLRRATLSVALNYVEGFARQRRAVLKNFLETAYGSLKESTYLLEFAVRQQYLNAKETSQLFTKSDEIAKMIWGITEKI